MNTCVTLSLLLLAAGVVEAGAPTSAPVGPEAILVQLSALQWPAFDQSRAKDDAYLHEYEEEKDAYFDREAQLQSEFCYRFPNDPPLHVVAYNEPENETIVITVYHPDPSLLVG